MEGNESENPWAVQIENFLHFCCPECDTKDKSRESFIQHALENHPRAIEYLLKNELSTENYTIAHDPLNSIELDKNEQFSDSKN